uniref:C2H2-type domain-containing protein n=1 Tax=Anopheles dirus TaxID=7168 RepID=A0A182MZT4_9DIPT
MNEFNVVSENKWSRCKICRLVITASNLWRHMRTQHSRLEPKRCEQCNKQFKNKYSLREHVRITHELKQQRDDIGRLLPNEESAIEALAPCT